MAGMLLERGRVHSRVPGDGACAYWGIEASSCPTAAAHLAAIPFGHSPLDLSSDFDVELVRRMRALRASACEWWRAQARDAMNTVSGRVWQCVGDSMPGQGVPLVHAALAAALASKQVFTAAEWGAFQITGLRKRSCVEVDGRWFVPCRSGVNRAIDVPEFNPTYEEFAWRAFKQLPLGKRMTLAARANIRGAEGVARGTAPLLLEHIAPLHSAAAQLAERHADWCDARDRLSVDTFHGATRETARTVESGRRWCDAWLDAHLRDACWSSAATLQSLAAVRQCRIVMLCRTYVERRAAVFYPDGSGGGMAAWDELWPFGPALPTLIITFNGTDHYSGTALPA